MKKILLLLTIGLLTLNVTAQKDYSENDVKQFYRTIQGDYTGKLDDTITLSLHFVPIWEREKDQFHWLYMEAINNNTKEIIEQKILEIKPISDIAFRVLVYDISEPERFVGKWGNRNFFDGFNTGILKRGKRFDFIKTKDFEYQTNWYKRKNLGCFPSGERVHFKFVQEDERFYVKRLLTRSSKLKEIVFVKIPIG
ncbi:MAG: hypothetical protein II887_01620 [Bacteroidales bacterium]|nr:hypothetical protein [Bacteroidales bacterium]